MKFKNHYLLLISFTLWISNAFSQKNLSYQVEGYIKNAVTGEPLPFAEIAEGSEANFVLADSSGYFKLNVTSNRVQLFINQNGYEQLVSDMITLDRFSKNFYTFFLHKTAIELADVEVKAKRIDESKPANELSYISTRSFSADDTEHIPASVNDPGRMALSFAGVQVGRDENENRIIIRGNSPQGVLWRVEGIDVPNPNHFARPGASGGGLTLFSAQLLDKSDFSIGGMTAEYGNAIAGAFDIRFREGNSKNRQHFVRAGILGIDLSTEGPIREGKSSYLINYRYSTLGLFNLIRVYMVGERTLNTFQDLSFNLVFHGNNGKTRTTVFGVGGKSEETFFPVKEPLERDLAFGEDWEERLRASSTGMVGVTHQIKLKNNASFRIAIAAIGSTIVRRFDTLNYENTRFRFNTEDYLDKRITTTAVFDKHFGSSFRIKTGVIGNLISYNFLRETYPRGNYNAAELQLLKRVFFDGKGTTQTGQAYFTTETKLSSQLKFQAGLHYLHLFLNNQHSFEPRFALNYELNHGQSLSLAYGRYSQLLPLTTYFVVKANAMGEYNYINQNMPFPQSQHLIWRYQWISSKHWKVAAEAYYQVLKRVQITQNGDYFWMLNYADGFADAPTIAQGTGKNYGIDVMVEHFFTKNYYLMATASVFDAKFKTLNEIPYNSSFNDRFGISLTAGKEFLTRKAVWQTGFRGMLNGGFRYSPIDAEASATNGFFVPIASQFNTLQAPNFYRIDTRIASKFRLKGKPCTVALDIQNVTATNNYSRTTYNRQTNTLLLERKGVGLVPIFSMGVGL